MTDRLGYAAEDRTMPGVVYALYLIGIANGFTVLIGLVLAYVNRGGASAKMRTHYTFLIRTFWLWFAWALIGGVLFLLGVPLSFVLIGLPIVGVSLLIFGLVHLWLALRTIVGVIYLARDEAYPRPFSWLL